MGRVAVPAVERAVTADVRFQSDNRIPIEQGGLIETTTPRGGTHCVGYLTSPKHTGKSGIHIRYDRNRNFLSCDVTGAFA